MTDENMIIHSRYPDLIRVRTVEPLDGFGVHVTFTDGSERDIDLKPYLDGPIFEPIRASQETFRQVFVDHGTLAWHNGADIDSDTLYYNGTPPWAEAMAQAQPPSSSNDLNHHPLHSHR